MSDTQTDFMNTVKMKETEKEQKQTNRRQTLNRLCSGSGLLLSVFCCVALIHQELRIQENHQMILNSANGFAKMETEILRKVQQNIRRWHSLEPESTIPLVLIYTKHKLVKYYKGFKMINMMTPTLISSFAKSIIGLCSLSVQIGDFRPRFSRILRPLT